MFSYKQLFDLHKILNNNSDVHDRVTLNENHIKQIFSEIENLNKSIKNLKNYTDNSINDFKDCVAEDHKRQETINGDYKYKLDDHSKQLQ